jgi:hypothetical protein
MTALYSLNNAWPAALPFRVYLPDGTTRTDPSTFTEAELKAWGYTGPYTLPTYDSHTEVLDWVGTAYLVRPMTPDEQNAAKDRQWVEVRLERNRLLQLCDWTQLPDSPADKQAWASYRQALRDITQEPDPFAIIWPQPPLT